MGIEHFFAKLAPRFYCLSIISQNDVLSSYIVLSNKSARSRRHLSWGRHLPPAPPFIILPHGKRILLFLHPLASNVNISEYKKARQTRAFSLLWWSRRGSNPPPSACKADALPYELRPQSLTSIRQEKTKNQFHSISWKQPRISVAEGTETIR